MKKKTCEESEIVVIGADHPNTLGIIRALGGGQYVVNLIIHNECRDGLIRCSKSRYFNGELIQVENEESDLVEKLLNLGTEKGNKKLVVIPTSDFAAYCVDKNYNQLSKRFLLPSIHGEQGRIVELMDKYAQSQLAEKYGIPMAKTMKMDLRENVEATIPKDWGYPVILKPVVSAKGSKSDITVVHSNQELEQGIELFKGKGYEQVLLQEYIQKEYELCVFGCLTKNSQQFYEGLLHKIREYPYEGGSTSYAKFIRPDERVDKIVDILRTIEYSGLFDIEIMMAQGNVILNEINFRNSANTWAIVKNGINAPAIWVEDILKGKMEKSYQFQNETTYYMNETSDLHYVFERKIMIFRWLKDLLRTRVFSKFWIKDIRGSLVWYRRK